MEEFIYNAKLLLSAVGHKFLETTATSSTNSNSEVFVFEGKDFKAKGTTIADGFVVFKESLVSKKLIHLLPQAFLICAIN